MSLTGFRLWKVCSSSVFLKQPRLSSMRWLNSSRFVFPRVWCPSSQFTTSRTLYNEKEGVQKKSTEDREHGNDTKITQRQKLKKVFAEYGSIAVVFHISMSLTSLGIVYTALKSGVDVPGALQKIGFSKNITDSSMATGASTFVVAYACYKVFAPVRMFITVTCTPLIVKKLRKMGVLKMPPQKQ